MDTELKGRNSFTICPASIYRAMEYWLSSVMPKEKIEVSAVRECPDGFKVEFSVVEEPK